MYCVFFCGLMDVMGIICAYNALFMNEETCNMPLRAFFAAYGIVSTISILYYMLMTREIFKGYIAKNTRKYEFIIEITILLYCITAHFLTYLNCSNCGFEAPDLQTLMAYAILVTIILSFNKFN